MKVFIWILISILVMQCKSHFPQKKFNYLALGDSYTIGTGASEQERYPVLLAKDLSALDIKTGDPIIIAQNGWTTDDLLYSIQQQGIQQTFDFVTLCIGVNNQYQGLDIETYRNQLKELLSKAIDYSGNRKNNIIVLSIPYWGHTPFANGRDREMITQEIQAYNQVKKEECLITGVRFVNISDLTLLVEEDPELLAEDSLHYSGKMYQLWVDEILENIKESNNEFPEKSQ